MNIYQEKVKLRRDLKPTRIHTGVISTIFLLLLVLHTFQRVYFYLFVGSNTTNEY
jgi:hypothetical protein